MRIRARENEQFDNKLIFRLCLHDIPSTTEKGNNRIFIWHSIIKEVRVRIAKRRRGMGYW